MPKTVTAQSNFTGGEASPRVRGRPDLQRYANALKVGENVIVLQQGGARLRPGTDYLGAAKISAKKARLIPFVFSQTVAYQLEFGDLYMRVWKSDVLVAAFELVTPYTEAMLPTLDFAQGADTMFIASGSLPIYRLQRFADNAWNLEPAPFDPVPFGEIGSRLAVVVTLSATTVGAGRTATAAAATWNLGDVGRRVQLDGGRLLITSFTSNLIVTGTIEQAFASVTLPSLGWTLLGSPQSTINPQDKAVGETATITMQVTPNLEAAKAITALAEAALTATATVPAHGYSNGDTILIAGNAPIDFNPTAVIAVLNVNQFTFPVSGPGPVTVLGTAQRSVSSGAGAWRAGDVGKYVKVNGGLLKIASFVSSAVVNAKVIQKMTSGIASPPGAWSLNDALWNTYDGYPVTVTLFEQRLWAAGWAKNPQGFVGSRSGLYLDFTLGTLDDDALYYTINSDEINPILFLNSGKELVALTYGPAFVIRGGVEKPVTPTNISIKPHTSYGAALVRPERVGTAILYAQRGAKKLRSLSYQIAEDGYVADDIGSYSEHIPARGLVAISVQTMPEAIVWLLLADGTLGALTYSKEQQVVAFTRCVTDGFVESVSTIPEAASGNEATHIVVRRTINGAAVRYVEKMNYDGEQDSRIAVAQAASTTVAGLAHLNGKTASVVAEGIDLGVFPVAAGTLTLPRAATSLSVGLGFTGTLELLPPEVGSGLGSSQGQANSQHRVYVRVLDSIGCQVNGQELPGVLHFGPGLLDTAPAPVSGLFDLSEYGWSADAPLVISQPRPYPLHVLGVIRSFTSNAG